ncbi:hypothetical protein DERP_009655 [Dermatophagoides pteronyssinus]|uniref:Uncharacterized protein n=1 Tax=Dermatophagoides pteronyssinus TaxID=6956 RepID=A0ABQ8JAG7_DERPT|nr:hypothetical protein DERP_009655 [Dermatophagoides pteronyssinus]
MNNIYIMIIIKINTLKFKQYVVFVNAFFFNSNSPIALSTKTARLGFCAADRHPSKRSAGTSSRNDIMFDRQSRVTRISAPSFSIIFTHLSSDSGQVIDE